MTQGRVLGGIGTVLLLALAILALQSGVLTPANQADPPKLDLSTKDNAGDQQTQFEQSMSGEPVQPNVPTPSGDPTCKAIEGMSEDVVAELLRNCTGTNCIMRFGDDLIVSFNQNNLTIVRSEGSVYRVMHMTNATFSLALGDQTGAATTREKILSIFDTARWEGLGNQPRKPTALHTRAEVGRLLRIDPFNC